MSRTSDGASSASVSSVSDAADFEDDGEDESDGGWQRELQRRYAQEANFMAELRARQQMEEGQQQQSGVDVGSFGTQVGGGKRARFVECFVVKSEVLFSICTAYPWNTKLLIFSVNKHF